MRKISFIALLAVTLFTACTKLGVNDKATLSYSFSLLNQSATLSTEAASGTPVTAGTNGSINWTSAAINIAKAEFSATQSGSAIAFSSSNLYNINPFKTDSLSGTVDIPTGAFENIRVKVTMNESNANPPLVLNGTYIEGSGTNIPVVVTLNSALSYTKEAQRIDVTSGKYIAKVTVELNALVKGLTAADFGQTTRTGSKNTIMVNSTTNRALYDKLLARLPNTVSVKVSK